MPATVSHVLICAGDLVGNCTVTMHFCKEHAYLVTCNEEATGAHCLPSFCSEMVIVDAPLQATINLLTEHCTRASDYTGSFEVQDNVPCLTIKRNTTCS
eukprot:4103527-Amphidinium_carterae.1